MRSTPRWLSALGQSPEAVYVVNDGQRIVCWNAGAKKLLGYSEAEVLNQLCYQIIGGRVCGKSWCRAGCAVQRTAKRGVLLQHIDMQARARSGDGVWLSTSVFTLERKARQFTIHLLRDMTRDEQTREALANFLDTLRAYGVSTGNEKNCVRPELPSRIQPPSQPSVSQLTRREIQVLELLAEGLSARDVAERLGISLFTVRRHIETILLKTGVHTQAQAVTYAYRNGLL